MTTERKGRRTSKAKVEVAAPPAFDKGLRTLTGLPDPEPAPLSPTAASSVPATEFLSLGRMMETHGGSTLEHVPGFDRARARNHGLLPMNANPVKDVQKANKSKVFESQGDSVGHELVEIDDTTGLPWRCIARLEITFSDGSKDIGTAWFMSDRCLGTAAHNIFSHREGKGMAVEIIVSPAFDGAVAPFRSFSVSETYCDSRWLEGNDDPEFDFGALRLASSAAGHALGNFGFASFEDKQFRKLQVNICGYANDRFPKSQYYSGGRLLKSNRKALLIYDFETAGGMSGAPVFGLFGQQRIVVGIHIQGSEDRGRARRIDPEVYKALRTFADRPA
ncbi:hypothetical protein [Sandarakinorhabdus sp.]|uniref:trypsin-like serine peptidase n=1 Tax=Sandarakinorhabdus sp. TaxID=1916663 RepID=UPI0033424812